MKIEIKPDLQQKEASAIPVGTVFAGSIGAHASRLFFKAWVPHSQHNYMIFSLDDSLSWDANITVNNYRPVQTLTAEL